MADKKGAQRIKRRSGTGRAGGRRFSLLIYSVMGVCILLLGARLFYLMNKQSDVIDISTVTVDVYGEVRNPGSYRVPEGTTRFEILQTAGIKPLKDQGSLSILNLCFLGKRTATGGSLRY